MFRTIALIALTSCLLLACDKSSDSASSPAADQKAEALLKEAYALIEQKNAAGAESKLTEVIALKPQLSEKVRAQVGPAIAGVGFVEPSRATKLAEAWEKP